MTNPDLWKKWVTNPEETIGESEKTAWLELQNILIELLHELKNNGKVELNFTESEIYHLKKLLKNRNEMVFTFNKIMDTTDNLETAKNFVQEIGKFGFNDTNYVYLLVELAVLSIITDTESFKTLLLFHLKDVDYRASEFINNMKKNAPQSWKKLKPFIDNKFRNSLAHGNWAMENDQVVLFENAKLVPFMKLGYVEFLLKVKAQSLLFGCLASVISEKIEKDFFA